MVADVAGLPLTEALNILEKTDTGIKTELISPPPEIKRRRGEDSPSEVFVAAMREEKKGVILLRTVSVPSIAGL